MRVEGDENNPVTQGRLCPRCIALKDYVYNPARLLHPMKRDPKGPAATRDASGADFVGRGV